jgi:hypothetical protein
MHPFFKIIGGVFFGLVLCNTVESFSQRIKNSETSKHEKVYISKDKIFLTDDQILIGKSDKWLPVSYLLTDKCGFYVLKDDFAFLQWECSECHFCNWFWLDQCHNCGAPRYIESD